MGEHLQSVLCGRLGFFFLHSYKLQMCKMRKFYSQGFLLKSKKLESSCCAGTHACMLLNICNKHSTSKNPNSSPVFTSKRWGGIYPWTYCQESIGLGCSSWQHPHSYIHGPPQITCRVMDGNHGFVEALEKMLSYDGKNWKMQYLALTSFNILFPPSLKKQKVSQEVNETSCYFKIL